jgi:hypothetical protein
MLGEAMKTHGAYCPCLKCVQAFIQNRKVPQEKPVERARRLTGVGRPKEKPTFPTMTPSDLKTALGLAHAYGKPIPYAAVRNGQSVPFDPAHPLIT